MKKCLTSFHLHIIAMFFMLIDHLGCTLLPQYDWLRSIGRLAFPIFAFMIVEGYFYTRDVKKYIFRMLIFALISEIPFNLMIYRNIMYPLHQNVLWAFLISLIIINILEKIRKLNKLNILLKIVLSFIICIVSLFLGLLLFVDYHYAGIVIILLFYFLRIKDSYSTPVKFILMILQFIGIFFVCEELIGGLVYNFNIAGHVFYFHQQSFAIFSLIFIWIYNGKRGFSTKLVKLINYIFYPLHMLILGLILQIFY